MRETSTKRVGTHREKLRAAGLRPVQIWVPDTRSRKFAAAAKRQSLATRNDPLENEILDEIERITDLRG